MRLWAGAYLASSNRVTHKPVQYSFGSLLGCGCSPKNAQKRETEDTAVTDFRRDPKNKN